MEYTVNVIHRQIKLRSSYEVFIAKLATIVGKLDWNLTKDVITEPEKVAAYLKIVEGDTGLMIFDEINHGALLSIMGKPAKAIQYVIGNPLVAMTMTVQDIRAGLYAPLRMIVYEDLNHQAFVEYDQPSTLFGQFDNDAVLEVGKDLDKKLFRVITLADSTPQ